MPPASPAANRVSGQNKALKKLWTPPDGGVHSNSCEADQLPLEGVDLLGDA